MIFTNDFGFRCFKSERLFQSETEPFRAPPQINLWKNPGWPAPPGRNGPRQVRHLSIAPHSPGVLSRPSCPLKPDGDASRIKSSPCPARRTSAGATPGNWNTSRRPSGCSIWSSAGARRSYRPVHVAAPRARSLPRLHRVYADSFRSPDWLCMVRCRMEANRPFRPVLDCSESRRAETSRCSSSLTRPSIR